MASLSLQVSSYKHWKTWILFSITKKLFSFKNAGASCTTILEKHKDKKIKKSIGSFLYIVMFNIFSFQSVTKMSKMVVQYATLFQNNVVAFDFSLMHVSDNPSNRSCRGRRLERL